MTNMAKKRPYCFKPKRGRKRCFASKKSMEYYKRHHGKW